MNVALVGCRAVLQVGRFDPIAILNYKSTGGIEV